MPGNWALQISVFFLLLFLCIKPLGWYIAQVYEGRPCGLDRILSPLEHLLYRLMSIRLQQEMDWKQYLIALLVFNFLGFLLLYFIQRLQFFLPGDPEHFLGTAPTIAFNTAASFITNTNWQSYSGESTMGHLAQMLGLTVQNFLSAATGMSLLAAVVRGLRASENSQLGNFWVDVIRGTLYILLPLSFIFAIFLSSQGVIQNFKPDQSITLVQPLHYQQGPIEITIQKQNLPMGPVASQVAIKQLGTNGGGFFNVNSAHPFENPTPLTNFFEMLAILLVPAALCYSFGLMVKDPKQGWALILTMSLLFAPLLGLAFFSEQKGNPALTALGVDQIPKNLFPGGNMEGKESRFGILNSALWATATSSTSNGSVNAMLGSFTPLGGLAPLWLMHLEEVVFGGVGSGLYGMLLFVIMTVFIAGLMVGRTPEYLGKKIEPYEMKMASLGILIMPIIVLLLTALAIMTSAKTAIANPGPHGYTEILYAFTSMTNNNGSAFAGLKASTPFYTILGGMAMLFGRYWTAVPALAIAGSLAKKKITPSGEGTLATHTPLFIVLLAVITMILGALSFLPALALGPIVEQLMLWEQYGY